MNKSTIYIKTIWKIGLFNALLVLIHRLKLKFGILSCQKPVNLNPGELFCANKAHNDFSSIRGDNILNEKCITHAEDLLKAKFLLFFHQPYQASVPPVWFYHPEYSIQTHWSKIPINSVRGRDIKFTWELSRFQWLPIFARAFLITHDRKYLAAMNLWCADWIDMNPTNNSVNWTCGQECSIRIINTLNATHILNGTIIACDLLQQFIIAHLKRIELTINYSIAQDNNHGTSEAAGLYIGAAWLESQSGLNPKYLRFAQRVKMKGQRLLEQRIKKLVGEDGGFSMSSTNYHRSVLNTVAVVELWRKKLSQTPFSVHYQRKCKALCYWLYKLTDNSTGGAPNLGANDGSNPFIVQTLLDYKDYRPAIQFATFQFFNALAYTQDLDIDESLHAFGIGTNELSVYSFIKESEVMKDSGIVIFNATSSQSSHAFLKFPVNRFRPYQADMLHFDFWVNGVNILSDAGSYSYCAEDADIQDYFSSIKAHNTIQIDNAEPMLRISPFLLGQWPKMSLNEELRDINGTLIWKGKYNWPNGASHQREIQYFNNKWIITDNIKGAKKNSTLRWRLTDSNWIFSENKVSNGTITIAIKELNGTKFTSSIENSLNSRYYNVIHTSPMLVANAECSNIDFITEISI